MSNSVGTKDHALSEDFGTPLNASADDSGYQTLSKTPSVSRIHFVSSTPASTCYLTPDVRSLPPPFELGKYESDDSQCLEEEWGIPENDSLRHKRENQISFDASCPRPADTERRVNATAKMPPRSNSMAFSPNPGQEVGEKHIDFFKELVHYRSFPGITRKILGYLPPRDLRNVCSVSKLWRQTCVSDSLSAKRMKELPNLDKENDRQLKVAIIQTLHARGPLGSIANVVNPRGQKCSTQASVGPVSGSFVPSRYQLFQEQAKKLLRCESLRPCPRCTSPSRVDPYLKRGLCSREICAYDFCMKCYCQYHHCLPCPVLSKPKLSQRDLIGSKGSRHNLKRL